MQTVVIGGGISGLACAFRLTQLGVPVLLLEQSDRVGGLIGSVEQEGFVFDMGPQSFLSNDALLDLIASLGLEPKLLRANPRAPRFVLRGGRLHPVPMAPPALLTTSLLSATTKLRLLTEPFRKSVPPEPDESVAAFARRKFGSDLLDNVLAPFVSGVYAGDPEKLSFRSAFPSVHQWEKQYGSILRGAIKSRPPKDKPKPGLCSFSSGLQTFTETLQSVLGASLRTGTKVEALRHKLAQAGKPAPRSEPVPLGNAKPQFELSIVCNDRRETLEADAVLVATPTEATAHLLASFSSGFQNLLAPIEYAPVVVVNTGYRREQVQHALDGFGFLVPRVEGSRVLGTVWNSSLFPGRAPEGMVSLASFVGGATDPDVLSLDDIEIAGIVEKEVGAVLRIHGAPVITRVDRYPRAIPQYNLGHAQRLCDLRQETARFPGLFLTGNYLEGPAIGACVETAFRTAKTVNEFLDSLPPR